MRKMTTIDQRPYVNSVIIYLRMASSLCKKIGLEGILCFAFREASVL